MDIKLLDTALVELIKRKSELEKLDYANPKYDEIEDALHELEDDFQEKFGSKLEEILQDVHDEFCSDNDVLLPTAYLGKGIIVDVDDFPGKDTRLVLQPTPPRIVLKLGEDNQKVVWTAK